MGLLLEGCLEQSHEDEHLYAENAVDKPERAQVSLVAGHSDRRQLVYASLLPFKDSIAKGIAGKQIIIKPNTVWHDVPACATHVDAIRGVLDFLATITDQEIWIAESSASPKGTLTVFKDYGYFDIGNEHKHKLLDLNGEPWVEHDGIQTVSGASVKIKVIKTFTETDKYIISLAKMKTHALVVATLSMKNFLMAAPWNGNFASDSLRQQDKKQMHGNDLNSPADPGAIWDELRDGEFLNQNMYIQANRIRPSFAIIDGIVGMEGNGPEQGTDVNHGVVLAGHDPIAVDSVGLKLMSVDSSDVPFLQWCADAGLGIADLNRVDLVGESLARNVRQYALPTKIADQTVWIRKAQSPVKLAQANEYVPKPFMSIERSVASLSPNATIRFSLPFAATVAFDVHDVKGNQVRRLVSKALRPGSYALRWSGRDESGSRVKPGHYIVKMNMDDACLQNAGVCIG